MMDLHPNHHGDADYRRTLQQLQSLPDHGMPTVGALADRLGTDKLLLLQWIRTDTRFARLIASKVTRDA